MMVSAASPLTVDPSLLASPCPGPHSVRHHLGFCVCADGYDRGNADTAQGCWRCITSCHSDALCVYPGVCACGDRFTGDGITNCHKKVARILDIYPKWGPTDQETLVNVTFAWDVNETVSTGFCRFGVLYRNAERVTGRWMTCRAPAKTQQVVRVAISLDGTLWSTDEITFEYRKPVNLVSSAGVVLLYVAVVAGITAFIWHTFGRGKVTAGDDERRPFLAAGNHEGAGVVTKKGRARKRAGV
jgi:hypothetical protein